MALYGYDLSTEILTAGGMTALGAITTAVLSHPVGAAGGAVFGISSYLAGRTVGLFTFSLIADSSTLSKVLAVAAGIFTSIGTVKFILNACCVPFSFTAVILFSAYLFVTVGVIQGFFIRKI